ncbi:MULTISPECIES: DUF5988 family protein [unclassified Streptomyces]|uniref:DUF5988 family protein n=1 Tax=unclassified Streptomyces TaxID=2593676 RepID=UPI0033B64DA0
MSGISEETGERMVDVRLVGGPDHFPDDRRSMRVDMDGAREKIKIKYWGGYQHFEPSAESGDTDGTQPRIYHWTGFTKIAE